MAGPHPEIRDRREREMSKARLAPRYTSRTLRGMAAHQREAAKVANALALALDRQRRLVDVLGMVPPPMPAEPLPEPTADELRADADRLFPDQRARSWTPPRGVAA